MRCDAMRTTRTISSQYAYWWIVIVVVIVIVIVPTARSALVCVGVFMLPMCVGVCVGVWACVCALSLVAYAMSFGLFSNCTHRLVASRFRSCILFFILFLGNCALSFSHPSTQQQTVFPPTFLSNAFWWTMPCVIAMPSRRAKRGKCKTLNQLTHLSPLREGSSRP